MINQCITAIVSSIEAKCEQQYVNGMHKINWAQFQGVQDTSVYFKTIAQLVTKRVVSLKGTLNGVYCTYLMNKIAK